MAGYTLKTFKNLYILTLTLLEYIIPGREDFIRGKTTFSIVKVEWMFSWLAWNSKRSRKIRTCKTNQPCISYKCQKSHSEWYYAKFGRGKYSNSMSLFDFQGLELKNLINICFINLNIYSLWFLRKGYVFLWTKLFLRY